MLLRYFVMKKKKDNIKKNIKSRLDKINCSKLRSIHVNLNYKYRKRPSRHTMPKQRRTNVVPILCRCVNINSTPSQMLYAHPARERAVGHYLKNSA